MAAIIEAIPSAEQGRMETVPADLALLLSHAFELGDWVKQSAYTAEYIYWKDQIQQDTAVQALTKELNKAKENFSECERFGRFHPDYNAALEALYETESRLDRIESVQKYKSAESSLDQLLGEISRTLAYAVSITIKVPDNDQNPKAAGCGNGGSCSCSSGGGCG